MAIDVQILYLLNSLAGVSPIQDSVIIFFASYFAYILIALCGIFVLVSHRDLREKIKIFLVIGIASVVARFGITEFIRFFIHRSRPFVDLPVHQLLSSNEWSFPSGHATFFFALATAVYLYNKNWGICFLIGAILVSVSRVVAGIHYPSDILAGALIGSAVAYATFWLVRTLIPTHESLVSTH